ncbi:hypothetical protein J6590_081530 [Homalodisca vitripennis]|nr:hypothetical protein J6590_081530 [Homalodisca vitripennis]
MEDEYVLTTLASRRRVFDLVFLHKLVNGVFDSPDHLRSFSFLVPVGTKSRNLFAASHYSNNYSCYDPIARLHRYGNDIPPDIDLFTSSTCQESLSKPLSRAILQIEHTLPPVMKGVMHDHIEHY